MPLKDEKQSYTLLSVNESDGQTSMMFQRAFQTCDDQDMLISVSIHVLYKHNNQLFVFISGEVE